MSDNTELRAAALAKLAKAVAFMRQCRAEPKTASTAAAFKDAREWLDESACAVVEAFSKRTMADVFIDAYEAWSEAFDRHRHTGETAEFPSFSDWAHAKGLHGDDEGQFLGMSNWSMKVSPEYTVDYAVIDFQDGSVALRRNHERDGLWLALGPRVSGSAPASAAKRELPLNSGIAEEADEPEERASLKP